MSIKNSAYIWGLVMLIIIILAYFYFRNKKETVKTTGSKKGQKSKKRPKKSNKSTSKKPKKENKDDEEDDDDDDDKAGELYELIHNDMSKGMTLDEFKSKVDSELADESVYMELKQIYNTTNPDEVTAKHYEKAIENVNN